MTPQRAAELVARWVRFYTRDLPTSIAQRRLDEIGADLHDHIAHEQARGTSEGRIAFSILSRMARGVTADASWRRRVRPLRPLSGDHMKSLVAIIATAILVTAIGVAAIVLGEADDSPGLQLLGVVLVVGAVVLCVRRAQRSR